jgi:5-deoxy-glucuronate isomerase
MSDARRLHWPSGTASEGTWQVSLPPERAGWSWSGLRVAELDAGGSLAFDTGEDEALVVPLSGSCVVECDGESATLAGRVNVFAGPTDFVYLPRAARLNLRSAAGGRFAVTTARTTGEATELPFRHLPASAVSVEPRGAGVCSRLVRNYCMPGLCDAQHLLVCEVVTPSGNWSSYPPHKHDERREDESELEEIYYFEIAPGPAGPGIAYQRVYGTPDRPLDLLAEVRSGDVVLIPHGWHGPSIAGPGYDLYYLNVMAGPGERAWLISDDPAHAWIRETWPGQAVDDRVLKALPSRRSS